MLIIIGAATLLLDVKPTKKSDGEVTGFIVGDGMRINYMY